MKNRKERREEARANGVPFEPIYKSSTRINLNGETYIVGGTPRTIEEVTNKGIERFNNKFVTIKEVEASEETTETTEIKE